jgi:hypothetical protein
MYNYITQGGAHQHIFPKKVSKDVLRSNYGHFYVFGQIRSLKKGN